MNRKISRRGFLGAQGGIALTVLRPILGSGVQAQPATPVRGDAPIAVEFPRDDGPHATGIEWWYFTGHLATTANEQYGFEYVIFRARSNAAEGFVSHFAITDRPRGVFHYDQRILGAAGVRGDGPALDLDLSGWTMRGEDGDFALRAVMPGYVIDLRVQTNKPAALHDGDGYVDYGNGTASYYYSWTRMEVQGTLDLGTGAIPVTGSAWMDHQWGDFATYQDGGWDWFSMQLEDGSDVMLYLIRDSSGDPLRIDGSLVDAQGGLTVLQPDDFSIESTSQWTSPRTGATYPAGWTVSIPQHRLFLNVTPVMPDQELDTRATTGVVYWEGEVAIEGTSDGSLINGVGYVELTGYAPYEPLNLATPLAM